MTNHQKPDGDGGPDCEIDDLDREILRRLIGDARTPFLEIARELKVAGGTIHQRVDRMRASGLVQGATLTLDSEKLGFGVTALVGLHLSRAQDCKHVLAKIRKFPEVIEAHYTTGTFALMLKVVCRDMRDYYVFLAERLQGVEGVRSTESFMCMASPVDRSLPI